MVIAILGILAAVAIPNIAKFIGEGESEAQATEWANLQMTVIAMMYDAGATTCTAITTDDPTDVSATGTNGTKNLEDYILGWSTGYTFSRSYVFASNGSVTVP